jgi:hypothetical protein
LLGLPLCLVVSKFSIILRWESNFLPASITNTGVPEFPCSSWRCYTWLSQVLGCTECTQDHGAHDFLRMNKFVLLPFVNCDKIFQTLNIKKMYSCFMQEVPWPTGQTPQWLPRIVTIFPWIQDEVFSLDLVLKYVR